MALQTYAAAQLPTAMDIGVAVGKSLGAAGVAGAKKMYERQQQQPKRRGTKGAKRAGYRDVFRDIGRKPNSNPNRRTIRESGVTTVANKELFDEPLIRVEKNVGGDETINKRNRDTINYKGTKICFMAKNILRLPIFLNWAIVVPKTGTVSSLDFLRDGSNERDMPVNNTATFMDLRCAPINSDRYRILMHKKHTILPDSDKIVGNPQSEGRDLKVIEEYIPLKRQVFFDGDTAVPIENAYMVWWCDFYNSTTGGVTSSTMDVSWRMIQYYQDIP